MSNTFPEGTKPREQKILKLFILMMLPVMTLAGFGGFASILMIGLFPDTTISGIYSPDGVYRARVLEVSGSRGCGTSTSYVVLVERRWGYIKTGQVEPLCLVGTASQLAVNWTGPKTLSIACTSCDSQSTYIYDQNWGRLHFQSDVERQ